MTRGDLRAVEEVLYFKKSGDNCTVLDIIFESHLAFVRVTDSFQVLKMSIKILNLLMYDIFIYSSGICSSTFCFVHKVRNFLQIFHQKYSIWCLLCFANKNQSISWQFFCRCYAKELFIFHLKQINFSRNYTDIYRKYSDIYYKLII